MKVACNSEKTKNQTTRPPLLSSETDHGVIITISSRHSSPLPLSSPSHSSHSIRPPSPLVSRNSTTPAMKRSVSAERRRPTKPDHNAGRQVSAAAKLLVTSRRSLSVSFQGETFSLPTRKTKMKPNLYNIRNSTPERTTTGIPVKGKTQSGRRNHVANTKPIDHHGWPCKTRQATNTVFTKSLNLDCAVEKRKVIESRNVSRVLRQSIDGGGRSSLDLGNAASPVPKSLASPSRMKPGSRSGMMTSSMGSSAAFADTQSLLSFAVDGRRRKVGENIIVDAHLLRLLYNRQLQWRFVNARTEYILLKRKHRTEKYLLTTWVTTSDLHDSVTKKRHRLQLLRQKLKLASILKEQMGFLETWASLDKGHSRSLLGAIEALKGSNLRLPVGGGATADIQSMNDAISSATVVMHAIGSSMRSLCLKAEELNSLVKDLANVSVQERTLMRICKEFLYMLMALKVNDCSLRTHMLQKVCL